MFPDAGEGFVEGGLDTHLFMEARTVKCCSLIWRNKRRSFYGTRKGAIEQKQRKICHASIHMEKRLYGWIVTTICIYEEVVMKYFWAL